MTEAVEVRKPVRAVDPDHIITWDYEGVTYRFKQPAGVCGGSFEDLPNLLIDRYTVGADGLLGADELIAKGHRWSEVIPLHHANRYYLQLLQARNLTEEEVEG